MQSLKATDLGLVNESVDFRGPENVKKAKFTILSKREPHILSKNMTDEEITKAAFDDNGGLISQDDYAKCISSGRCKASSRKCSSYIVSKDKMRKRLLTCLDYTENMNYCKYKNRKGFINVRPVDDKRHIYLDFLTRCIDSTYDLYYQ